MAIKEVFLGRDLGFMGKGFSDGDVKVIDRHIV